MAGIALEVEGLVTTAQPPRELARSQMGVLDQDVGQHDERRDTAGRGPLPGRQAAERRMVSRQRRSEDRRLSLRFAACQQVVAGRAVIAQPPLEADTAEDRETVRLP